MTGCNLVFKWHAFGRAHIGAYPNVAYSSKGKCSSMKADPGGGRDILSAVIS